jgi:hypothetical protein
MEMENQLQFEVSASEAQSSEMKATKLEKLPRSNLTWF